MSKRAQMEILGLAIIVVLIMLGVLFAIQFVLRAPPEQAAQEYRESQLAASLVTTMLATTTECRGATVAELLQDCAVFNRISGCPTGDPIDTSSCKMVSVVTGQILAGTLEAWERDYRFSISGGPSRVEEIYWGQGECLGDIESNTNPVPTAAGPLQVRLDLCS